MYTHTHTHTHIHTHTNTHTHTHTYTGKEAEKNIYDNSLPLCLFSFLSHLFTLPPSLRQIYPHTLPSLLFLPSITSSLPHPFPPSPLPSITLSLHYPFPPSPLPSLTPSLPHPFLTLAFLSCLSRIRKVSSPSRCATPRLAGPCGEACAGRPRPSRFGAANDASLL